MIKYFSEYSGAFDNEQIGLMSVAFEQAWKALQATKASYAIGDRAESTRAALAKYIIEAATQGELDSHELGAVALKALDEKLKYTPSVTQKRA